MVSLIGLNNKDTFVRMLSVMLTVETGKLKRLLVHKDKSRNILSDILYYQKDKIKEQMVQKLSLFYCFKDYGTKE